MSKSLSWIFLLMLLSACGQVATPTSVPLTPTKRIAPSPEAATPMDTSTPSQDSSTANADVTYVRAVQSADGSWTFHVTVSHPDTGWEDYVDGWDVVLPDGTILKVQEGDVFTRLLLHPHVDEQPFTRSQSGILIPENVTQVTVRAHDLVDGFGGQEVVVDLTKDSGENFEVTRYQN